MTTHEILGGGVAVITGAASGIGEGIAREAASLGMSLVLADIAAERLQILAKELQNDGATVLAVPTDVTYPAAIDRLAARTHERFGDIRLLVNNAGLESLGNVWELSAETWQRIVSVNILGVIHGARAFLPRMIASGQPGFIANLSSVGGLGMMPIQTGYILSKHAVLSFSECLALEIELAGATISVSAVLPGPVNTRIFDDAPIGDNPHVVDRHRQYMQTMLREDGCTGREAGHRILAGVAKGDFWVSTHPDIMRAAAQERAVYLQAMARPALSEAAQAILR